MGDRTLGYVKKIEALRGKQKFVYTLLKIALTRLEFGVRIIEKLVLVTHDKHQRLLGAQSTKDWEPTTLKRKTTQLR